MKLNDYQKATEETAVYPGKGKMEGLVYTVLGLNGEAGEVADKLKKLIRDKGGELSVHDTTALVKELGDVLWYVAQCADQLGFRLEAVANLNLQKLLDRKVRDMIGGSGDDR